jgi:hypothetical protein
LTAVIIQAVSPLSPIRLKSTTYREGSFGIDRAFKQPEGLDEMPSRNSQGELQAKEPPGVPIMKSLTIIQWYRILRAHHQWTVFQSIRYALWLVR